MLENFYTCYIVNKNTNKTLYLQPSKDYTIESIDGLSPPTATINGTPLVGVDGQTLSNNRIDTRTITINLYINSPAETNRINLYSVFKLKDLIKINFKNGTRNVFAEGYIENFEINLFSIKQTAQITIKCFEPYFKSLPHYIHIGSNSDLFEYPFEREDNGDIMSEYNFDTDITFNYNGDTETGMEIEITSLVEAEIQGPIMIHNPKTQEVFAINKHMESKEKIEIDTNAGKKRVYSYINGISYTRLELLGAGSKWLQIRPGQNTFNIVTKYEELEKLEIKITYYEKYLGV